MNQKIAKIVAEQIIKKLDEGVVPWRQTWVACGGAKSHVTGRSYSLLNQMRLDGGGEYVTYKQAEKEGGKVRKGEKAKQIVFWKLFTPDANEDGEDAAIISASGRKIPYLQYYNVFRIDACDGLTAKFPDPPLPCGAHAVEQAETVWRDYCKRENLPYKCEETSPHAFYDIGKDAITVPNIKQFRETAEYYSVIFHEIVHSTGNSRRLNRPMNGRKGTAEYAREELIAEIGSAVICARLGLDTPESFSNSAAYIKGWRDKIAEDNSLIVVAAGRAEKAVNYILGTNEAEEESE